MPRAKPTTMQLLTSGFRKRMSNEAVLASILAMHPCTTMTRATVNWYRNRMRKNDSSIPSEHELKV